LTRHRCFDDEQVDEPRFFERHLSEKSRTGVCRAGNGSAAAGARLAGQTMRRPSEEPRRGRNGLAVDMHPIRKAEFIYGASSHAAFLREGRGQRQLHLKRRVCASQAAPAWEANCGYFGNRAAWSACRDCADRRPRELDAETLYEPCMRPARANGFIHNEARAQRTRFPVLCCARLREDCPRYLPASARLLRWGADGTLG